MADRAPPCAVLPLHVTVLIENTHLRRDLVSEHGFAAYLETDGSAVLFDAGATGEALAQNARALGVDLSRVAAIILSHGHYDHTGGLAAALAAAPRARVCLHWRTSNRRWATRLGIKKSIGMPRESTQALAQAHREWIGGPRLLPEGLIISGPVAGPAARAQKGFLAGSDRGPQADDFADEMFALARTPSGWVLVTGCCHRGLVNTLAHARALSGGEPIRTVLGGFHLKRLARRYLDAALQALDAAGTREIFAGHCTGDKAIAYLAAHSKACVEPLHVGFEHEW